MIDSEYFLKTIIETMQDALMVVDTDGMIISVNKALEDMTGYNREEMIGASCSILGCDICLQVREAGRDDYCELYNRGGIRHRKCVLHQKNGSLVHVIKNAAILRNEKDEIIGGVETLTDISDVVARDRMISDLQREMHIEESFHGILGKSPVMTRLFGLIESAAQSEAPVLILGESGTGKELAARALHDIGPRSGEPFITVNCAALNDSLLESELFGHVRGAFTGADRRRIGRFEAAHGGDIFLDEIGDLPLSTQVKLLRVLQEKVIERVGEHTPVPVDVRIITATNKNLKKLMTEGRFREDLYYRISVIPIHIPPLRRRREDIPLLAETFIKRIAIRNRKNLIGVSPKALEALMKYDWPGNVRELINLLEFAFVICSGGKIQIGHLPQEICRPAPGPGPGVKVSLVNVEERKKEIAEALEKTGGRKAEAANLLGISRVALWKRIKKLGLPY